MARFYQEALGRNADPVGLAVWAEFLRVNCNPLGVHVLATTFFDSLEFRFIDFGFVPSPEFQALAAPICR